MDENFFQTLRKIQKMERNNSSLARVEPDFYKKVHSYINQLKRSIGDDPFADEQYLLKDSQRIATEICERREHKITDAAVMNIHRSYHLFSKSKPAFDLLDTTPLNLTPEEETLYFSLIDTLKDHRLKISLDKFGEVKDAHLPKNPNAIVDPFDDEIEETTEIETNNVVEVSNVNHEEISEKSDLDSQIDKPLTNSDAILDKLQKIKEAKVVKDEKYENIDKQVAKSNSDKSNIEESNSAPNIGSTPNIGQLYDDKDQFVDLDPIEEDYNQYYNQFDEPNPFEVDELIGSKKPIKKSDDDKCTLLVFNDIGAIMGVDEKVYGPFHSQDIVVLPKLNAEILINSNQAKLID